MHVGSGSGDDGSGKNKLKTLKPQQKPQTPVYVLFYQPSQPFCLPCFTFAVVLGFSLPQKKVSNFPISYYD